jgi:hypothetical protein
MYVHIASEMGTGCKELGIMKTSIRKALKNVRTIVFVSLTVAVTATGCMAVDSDSANITDVNHTDVERQSIGNCWLYAQASWVESMHLTATGESFDISQSYWTYWHWYDQLTSGWSSKDEISTGGNQWTSNDIVLQRGIVPELAFVAEDAQSEMSNRQSAAKSKINSELESGRLEQSASRRDGKLVRQVLNEAWQLQPEVVAYLDAVFGEDGRRLLDDGDLDLSETPIISANDFAAEYIDRSSGSPEVQRTNLATAINAWRTDDYPNWGASVELKRREFQIRVQRALHDGQPVVITWDVDFNAMESGQNERRGSFNMTTLGEAGGAGRQGGHMTVLEDYEAETEAYGLLKAGDTLDPDVEEDAAKLEALLDASTKIKFFRIKNSWGSWRDDRASAPGFPGYHDLYLDYLNGPIKWCPSEDDKSDENCRGETIPFNSVMLPPGY